MKKFYLPLIAGAMALSFAACGGQKAGESVELSGAGATFPLPFYNMSFEGYDVATGNKVSYGGIGSGGGVRNLKDEIVDFAGSDAFLTDEEMKDMKPVVHIPTCMGAVVLAYNLPDVVKLNLSGDVIADIYAGKITKWNDARLVELNPEVKLPAKDIIVAYRSDGSGTTFIFTDYLSKVSENWKNTYGAGKTVDFPVGQAAKGNPGVAGIIAQTPYSFGYIGSECEGPGPERCVRLRFGAVQQKYRNVRTLGLSRFEARLEQCFRRYGRHSGRRVQAREIHQARSQFPHMVAQGRRSGQVGLFLSECVIRTLMHEVRYMIDD